MIKTVEIPPLDESDIERFWDKVDKGNADECWEWQASRVPDGYGEFSVGTGVSRRANRVSYKLEYGEIPDGMYVLHKCHNPPCVNPNHLYAGTQTDNIHDMIERGTFVTGEDHPNYGGLKGEDHPMYGREHSEEHKENIGKAISGENNGYSKLTWDEVDQIREIHDTGEKNQYEIADMFNVSQSCIWHIVNNKRWVRKE